MSKKQLRVKSDALLPGIQAIGVHGRLGADQTPARRPAVLADSKNRLVDIREASPKESGGFTVTAEVTAREIPQDVWQSTGTRVDPPWPALLGHIVVIVGEREERHASELAKHVVEGEPIVVSKFLRWLTTGTDQSEELHCCRIGSLMLWYCDPEEARALWRRLALVARAEVFACARRSEPRELINASFWLSRAAVEESDIFLAAAGLRQATYPHWEALLEAGVRTGTKTSRIAAVDEAAKRLIPASPKTSPSPSTVASSKFKMAHRALDSSFKSLSAAEVAA